MISITPETFSYIIGGVSACGLAWALWPAVPWVWSQIRSLQGSVSATATYEEAIHYLAVVRTRVKDTGLLGEDQRKAIDLLTLALVDGCDWDGEAPEVAPDAK